MSVAIVINDSPVFEYFFPHVPENGLNLDRRKCKSTEFSVLMLKEMSVNLTKLPGNFLPANSQFFYGIFLYSEGVKTWQYSVFSDGIYSGQYFVLWFHLSLYCAGLLYMKFNSQMLLP